MNKRVYLLTIVSFVVGMVELIIGGILDLVAQDLQVSIGKAGFLITVFSLVFAVASPVLLMMTSKVERKKLTLISLLIFFIGNAIAVFSPSYSMLLIARIVSAASGSLLVVLCITIASSIVSEDYRARAIGVVFMGISASLVLGVPIGLMLGNAFGWRAPFILIAGLTLFSMAGVYFFMDSMFSKPAVSLIKQLRTLKNRRLLFAQLTSFLFLAGHLTLYGYLTPFLKTVLGLNGNWVSIVYLIFGCAAVAGGGVGGTLADRIGTRKSIIGFIIVFGLTMFVIPYTTFSLPLFLGVMVIWSMLSWAITPAMQSYLIESSTAETSDIQQSLNNTALHFGIAFGSAIGGFVIEQSSVESNATVGGCFIIIALAAALISMAKRNQHFSPIKHNM
ncbi:MFS transporter, DHA1 family, putative efflux transporter [Fictibacillus solisalsi]|uniref:MFS transporter, DHA1 family, putative efflux transporter n=1 Tax=Fictibacillus solisalsi TaxID=459525 RepID=A0A1G9U087_9BACL|nr:MFS transporter [Fictibacillus solisalsi]SDM53302.1 MFS transporter, DHA1 family, putative efflux transporter [Fictibacillus solisalsi]